MPADVQPLARRALAIRGSLVRSNELTDNVTTSYMTIERRFDANTWVVFVPAAKELSQGDLLQTNSMLSSLARSIVVHRPRHYAVWLLKASVRSVYMIFSKLLVNPFVLLMLGSYLYLAHPD